MAHNKTLHIGAGFYTNSVVYDKEFFKRIMKFDPSLPGIKYNKFGLLIRILGA